MRTRFLRTIILALLGTCLLRADSPYIIRGSSDANYSMSNLPKLPALPKIADKDADGTCLTWAKYWAPSGVDSPMDSLTGVISNPINPTGYLNWGIKFRIDRVVTDEANLDANGFLKDPQALIAQGVIRPEVEVEFEAIEYVHGNGVVKTWFGNNRPPAAYKLVSVNRKQYWSGLSGVDGSFWHSADHRLPYNHWRKISLMIPISMVKFPRRAAVGSIPIPAENQLEFTTDAYPFFSYAIDAIQVAWAKARVKAMAPIVLVHGTNADPKTWNDPEGNSWDPPANRSFNNYFSTFTGICFNDIALTPNGAINQNGKDLEDRIKERLTTVGARTCHIVAHSKGGLDSRAMIYDHYGQHRNESLNQPGNFEVLSLYTLDTPHRGTVLSDIAWNALHQAQAAADPKWHDLDVLMAWDWARLHNPPPGNPDGMATLPTGSALEAQMTRNMGTWNSENGVGFSWLNTGGRPLKFYNTASDADWNVRDLNIDDLEKKFSSFDSLPPLLGRRLATSSYRMLYYAKQVKARPSVRTETVRDKEGNSWEIVRPVTELFVPYGQEGREWNDTVVAISSAVYDGGTLFCPVFVPNLGGIMLKNHSSVKSSELADGVVEQIRTDWPLSSH